MLRELRIENFVLISELYLEFSKGLNVFTGETGAGKSMIIGALNAGLGEKVNGDIIRQGTDKAVIQLVFEVDESLESYLRSLGVDVDDGLLIITREVLQSNRSTIRMNGRIVTLGILKEVGTALMDIHGQHAHQGLLYPKNHLKYLDMMGDSHHRSLLDKVQTHYQNIKSLQEKLSSLQRDEDHDLDYLRFQIHEIDALALTDADEEPLTQKYEYYKNLENIHGNVFQVSNAINSEEGISIKDMLQKCIHLMKPIASFDHSLESIHELLHTLTYQVDDIQQELRHFLDGMDVDEAEMRYVEDRINAVNALKLKHGQSIGQILEKREHLNEKLHSIEDREAALQVFEAELLEAKRHYLSDAKALSESRQIIKAHFEASVIFELEALNMKDTVFEVSFIESTLKEGEHRLAPYGLDQVEYLISTNPGMPLGPLSKIASGGEISRIMLAIKLALSHHDDIDTLVFDEVDTGISGVTARIVGEKIYNVTKSYQVLCITHLPQIAVMADRHFLIEKFSDHDLTTTEVAVLHENVKLREIARMLSGDTTDVSINNAQAMLMSADRYKEIS